MYEESTSNFDQLFQMNNNTRRLNQTEIASNEDVIGAMIYTIVVLLWYWLSIVFLLGMEANKSSGDTIDDPERRLFTRSFREKTNTKKILGKILVRKQTRFRCFLLEELVDKKKRDKLWDIYLDKSKDMRDRSSQAEKLRIRNIRRQIANITELERPIRVRRRSPDDQRILEQWKATVNCTRINENCPWAIQKLMIRRQLRRQRYCKDYVELRKSSVP